MNISAVLLDFDNTIVFSEDSRFESIKKTLSFYGCFLSEDEWEKKYLKKNSRDIFQEFIDRFNLSADVEEMYEIEVPYRKEIIEKKGLRVVPGFFQFIDYLNKNSIDYIICSGGSKEHLEFSMKHSGIKNIDFISRENYTKEKPAPDCYKKGLEILNKKTDEVLIIDDSYYGLLAGIEAGCDNVIGLNCRNREEVKKLPVLDVVDDFTQIDLEKFFD